MSKLLISEPPLVILPSLAKAIGLNEAIFLQQLHYWLLSSEHAHDGSKWVYNTLEDWQKQFPFWSVMTIRRTITSLKSLDLISTTDEYNKSASDRTTWYTINYDKVPGGDEPRLDLPTTVNQHTMNSPSVQNEHLDLFNVNTSSITETTTKKERVVAPAVQPSFFAEEDAAPPVAPPPPKGEPTPHVTRMLVLSDILFGHRNHTMWSDTASKLLGKLAKKLKEQDFSPEDLVRWHQREWPKHWAAKNGRPTYNQLLEGLAQWKQQREAPTQPFTIESAGDWSEDDE